MLSTADAGVVRRDAALSGLGLVLDPEALTDRINHIFAEAAVESAKLLSVATGPKPTACLFMKLPPQETRFLCMQRPI